jgi:hypothetical protein
MADDAARRTRSANAGDAVEWKDAHAADPSLRAGRSLIVRGRQHDSDRPI